MVKWYQSRGFWTAALTGILGVLVATGVISPAAHTEGIATIVLGLLSGLFRWKADAPLTT